MFPAQPSEEDFAKIVRHLLIQNRFLEANDQNPRLVFRNVLHDASISHDAREDTTLFVNKPILLTIF